MTDTRWDTERRRVYRGSSIVAIDAQLSTLRLRGLFEATQQSRPWVNGAACRDLDPNLFFPVERGPGSVTHVQQAKQVCAGCTVREECLEYALVMREVEGVWGGTSENERRRLRRRRAS